MLCALSSRAIPFASDILASTSTHVATCNKRAGAESSRLGRGRPAVHDLLSRAQRADTTWWPGPVVRGAPVGALAEGAEAAIAPVPPQLALRPGTHPVKHSHIDRAKALSGSTTATRMRALRGSRRPITSAVRQHARPGSATRSTLCDPPAWTRSSRDVVSVPRGRLLGPAPQIIPQVARPTGLLSV